MSSSANCKLGPGEQTEGRQQGDHQTDNHREKAAPTDGAAPPPHLLSLTPDPTSSLGSRLIGKHPTSGLYVRGHPGTSLGAHCAAERAPIWAGAAAAFRRARCPSARPLTQLFLPPCRTSFPPLLAWDGVIFVHKGMYAKGTFKFRLLIPPTYPDTAVPVRAPRAACCASKLAAGTKQENNVLLAVRRSHIHSPPLPILPRQRIFFQTHVFHPRVDSTTLELDLSNQYQEWAPRTDRLWHLLKYIYHIFYNIDVENARNTKAAALCVRLLKRALACGARGALGPTPPPGPQRALALFLSLCFAGTQRTKTPLGRRRPNVRRRRTPPTSPAQEQGACPC